MHARAAIVALAIACSGAGLATACSSDEASTSAPLDVAEGGTGNDAASALPQTCARGARSTEKPATCNGDAALCTRTYDRVVVPMTHNAMSDADEGWTPPNQTHGIARQLADGVRGMMLDLHYYDVEAEANATGHIDDKSAVDQVYLCHGVCALGRTRLLDGLCTITTFLDEHPGEVFSIIFENDVADADTDEVLRASGLADYAYTHPKGAPWPTLRELVDTGKRLVVFLEQNGGSPAYLHRGYTDEMWDTPYSFMNASEFTCALGRGAKANTLFLVNHWLGRPFADIALAREVNTAQVLGDRVAQCTTDAGRAPTFVSVDFYDVGDLFGVVRKANGL
ncbi:MAG: putative integral rane protein [Labilithrix sp.]|nr:putative integral rane protein [Labilithrix sp.]